jgi:NADH:ubiquinone reductase (H+-translocating)
MRTLRENGLPSAAAAGAALGIGWAFSRWFRSRPEANGRYRPRRSDAKRIVILGAGFGGLTTAIELSKQLGRDHEYDITLIDRVNFHLFTPMLYQVATGLLEPGHIAYPVRAIAREFGFSFMEAEVIDIDLDRRRVHLDSGELAYDSLVIALGSTTNYFGNANIPHHAASLKTLRDAVAIRNRLVDAFERADAEADEQLRRAWLTFVVVGGGATGVELMGSIHSLVQHGFRRSYPRLDASEVRLVLAEGGQRLLGGADPFLGDMALQRLRQKGVDVRLNSLVTEVADEGARFKDGTFLPSRTIIWAAGVQPAPLAAGLSTEKGRDGRLVVDEYLRVKDASGVYALGDNAWFPVQAQGGRPAPPNAATAVREATVVAHNVAADLRGESPQRYEYRHEGDLVALGQGDGVADVLGLKLYGFPAWLVWRGFYLNQLMGFKNRIQVAVDWFSAYFVSRDTAKLDVGAGPSLTDRRDAIREGRAGSGPAQASNEIEARSAPPA